MEESKDVASIKANEKSFIAPLALAIAIGSCLGVFYTWTHAYKSKHQFVEIASVESTLQQTIQQQQQSIQELQNNVNQLREETHRGNDAWVLAEVDYIIRLANLNLEIDRNVAVAIKLLKSADDKVKNLSKLGGSSVRKAIANSLSALNAVPQFDIEGVVLSLQSMSKGLETLPLVKQNTVQPLPESNPKVETSSSTWREMLNASMKTIKDMVVIRRLDQPVKPLVHPDQHANLIENMQLQLSIAQWAVLHHDAKIYQASLHAVNEWLQEYFQMGDEVKAVLKTLNDLQAINVAPPIPSLDIPLNEIQNQKPSLPTAPPEKPGDHPEKLEVISS